MFTDLKNREDLEIVFTDFYSKAINHTQIGHFFTTVIPIDLKTHLPHILDFWEYNLWNKGNYSKNLLKIHQNIHEKSAIQYIHLDIWVDLLNEAVNKKFSGFNAEKLKTNALSIATVMKYKIK